MKWLIFIVNYKHNVLLSFTHSNTAQPSRQAYPLPLSNLASLALVNAKSSRYDYAQLYDTAHAISRNQCTPLGLLPNAD